MKARVLCLTMLMLVGCDRFTSPETRMERASAALQAGEHQAALIDVRKALQTDPENLSAQLLLVDILAASGEKSTALEQLDKAVSAGAAPEATEARKIKLLLGLQDANGAQQALDASSTLPPDERETFEGRLLLLRREPADAERAFLRALKINPALIDAQLGRIEALAAQGRTNEALEMLAPLLADEAASARAWLLKGQLAVVSEDFATAAEAFAAAVERAKTLDRDTLLLAHVQRIESLLASGRLAQANAALDELQALAGDAAVVSLLRARVLLANHETAAAVNELRRFTQAVPQHLPGRLLLASALLQQGSTEQAYAEAVRNVAEFGQYDEPRIALASIEIAMGRFDNAEKTLQSLITRPRPNPQAIAMLAELRIRHGEAVAGVSLLEQSVGERPHDARLKLQLASAYLSTGEAKRALATLETIEDKGLAATRDRLRVIATAALSGSASAEQELSRAIARHPEDVDLLLMAATYHANLNQMDRARSYMERARQFRPNDPLLMLALGRLELAMGQPDAAEALAKLVLERSPNDAAAMTLMANIAAQRGQEDEVDAWLNRARLAKPDALDVSVALARRALVRGNSAEARNILQEAVRSAPTDPRARIALAELHASAGRHKEALQELRAAARDHADSPLILLSTARVHLAAKDVEAARTTLKQALAVAPEWLPAAATLVALESSLGNLAGALEVARELGRADRDSAHALTLEGQAYLAAKRPTEAAKAFVKAYERTPSFSLAAFAAQAKSAAKLPKPEAELQDWIRRMPSDLIARRTLADYHMAAGRNDAAIEELEKVVEARPKDAIALNNLAWLYHATGDKRGLTLAERAYAEAPRAPAIADTYGWILAQNGRVHDGLKVLTQAAELAPNNWQIQYHFARVLAEAGEHERALSVARRIVSAPEASETRQDAQRLLTELSTP